MKSAPTILYEFVNDLVLAAQANTILFKDETEVLDSAYQEITKDRGIVVSNSEFDLAPKQNGLGLYDALVILGFYYRIPSADTTERMEARDKCFEMTNVVTTELFRDETLGNRICNLLVLRAVDGMKNTNSDSFAIINLPVILNPTGDRIDYTLGEAR
jgi:hypothetical protein